MIMQYLAFRNFKVLHKSQSYICLLFSNVAYLQLHGLKKNETDNLEK